MNVAVNLAEALDAQKPKAKKGPPCSVGLLLDELDETNRSALLAALSNPRKEATEIARQLVKAGMSVNAGAVRRHRITPYHERECACRGY